VGIATGIVGVGGYFGGKLCRNLTAPDSRLAPAFELFDRSGIAYESSGADNWRSVGLA
jgi:hypothetical protein